MRGKESVGCWGAEIEGEVLGLLGLTLDWELFVGELCYSYEKAERPRFKLDRSEFGLGRP